MTIRTRLTLTQTMIAAVVVALCVLSMHLTSTASDLARSPARHMIALDHIHDLLDSIGLAVKDLDDITYGEDERHPFRVTVTIDRLEDGRKLTMSANADMEECYRGGEWWDTKPALMLEKTAEKKALRKAFPEEFGDVDGGDEEFSDKEPPVPEPGELTYVAGE